MWGHCEYDTRNVWFVTWGDEGEHRRPRSRPGERLASALSFARRIVPKQRVLPVVLEQNQPWWERVVRDLPPENVMAQPLNRGSAPGILAAALRVMARDPDAILVLMSTEGQHPERQQVFRGIDLARRESSVVVLPKAAEARAAIGCAQVLEIEPTQIAWEDSTLEAGTTTVARASLLVDVFRSSCPEMVEELGKPEVVQTPSTMDLIFPFLPDTDFMTHVLGPAPDHLRVLGS